MVKIEITKQNTTYRKLTMQGHAGAGPNGSDLVCAALSGIISGALNAFHQKDANAFDFQVTSNQVVIVVIHPNAETNLLMEMLAIQLITIANEYPKNVKIKEVG
ncbi:hypothetical protein JN01_0239 [Entomoplasma freundtii]|uniref:Ribosomal processing cysteine protease Prp n=1 Tax=Entomoplasma freundtii TaxID=74700 RepID=A0A2K8NUW2_9MOLU|nr:ribosomal-processing cysteine protease Prp [Entomoplasma freundtii]ATZ16551.1 hypothetical protein EFREU_v1c05300 [Entomoplasma freundtii]TDY58283.1 hypothetical protein JN01_0239 [Entomoplasma freundtii]